MDLSVAITLDLGNAQDPGARRDQQDAFAFSDPADESFVAHGGVLAVLADGMGGMERGAIASRAAVRAFLAAYRAKSQAEQIADALDRSVRSANDAVCAEAPGSGTTLVAAAVRAMTLHWVSAGDSALLLHRRNELITLTNAHVYARELEVSVANGGIGVAQALAHPDRDCLTSYVGMERMGEIDCSTSPFALEPQDRVILATDGLYKTLDPAEMARGIGGTSQESCERLVQTALEKAHPAQDNITVLMFTVQQRVGVPEAAQTRQMPPPPKDGLERWMFWRRKK